MWRWKGRTFQKQFQKRGKCEQTEQEDWSVLVQQMLRSPLKPLSQPRPLCFLCSGASTYVSSGSLVVVTKTSPTKRNGRILSYSRDQRGSQTTIPGLELCRAQWDTIGFWEENNVLVLKQVLTMHLYPNKNIFKKFLPFIDSTERAREGEREGEKHRWER